ncbi:MAG TPA: aminopeptidase, partial [Candidatus Angelobacter sp.]|nr:aminopeptidase [Candidatus Angelobacter sp.]
MTRTKLFLALLICFSLLATSQQYLSAQDALANHIKDELGVLASDAMQGRGSGTDDELRAATYIASELKKMGVAPAGDNGGYIQDVS